MDTMTTLDRKELIERLKINKPIMDKFTFPFGDKNLTEEDHIRIEKEMGYWIDFLEEATVKAEKIHKEIQEEKTK